MAIAVIFVMLLIFLVHFWNWAMETPFAILYGAMLTLAIELFLVCVAKGIG